MHIIHIGDVSDVLPTLPDEHFDAVLCDPPYGLSFMGKAWDKGVPSAEVWALVRETLKPGAHLLAAGGTRTFHRLTCAIEDSGFKIRDCLSWMYGTGFPKSLNVGKAIDKAAGAEREVTSSGASNCPDLAAGRECSRYTTRSENSQSGATKHTPGTASATPLAKQLDGYGTALKPAWEPIVLAMKPTDGTFAANAEKWGVAGLNIDGGRVAALDGYTENAVTQGLNTARTSYAPAADRRTFEPSQQGRWPANVVLDEEAAEMVGESSRFFYTAKASKAERAGSKHPTLKPLALTEYLAKLLLPPPHSDGSPRRILVPFSGAGSEMIGALRAGWEEVVGIELEAEYAADAEHRIAKLA